MTTQPPRTTATRQGLAARCASGGTAGPTWGRDCPCACDYWSPHCRVFLSGVDAVGFDDNAAAADHGHATRISSPLCKQGNLRPDVGEGLSLYLGSLVATLLELPLASAEGMGYWSATDVHWDLKAIAEGGARLGMGMSWRGSTRRAASGSGATHSTCVGTR